MVSFYMDTDIVEAYKKKAKQANKKDSDIVREALRKDLSIPVSEIRAETSNAEQKKGIAILDRILETFSGKEKTRTVFVDWENDIIAINSKPISFGKANILITWVAAHLKKAGLCIEVLPRKDIVDIGSGKNRIRNIGFDLVFEEGVSKKELAEAVRKVKERLHT